MLKTIAAVATAAALGLSAATTVATAAGMRGGPSPGGGSMGGGNIHSSVMSPGGGAGPVASPMVHGNISGSNSAFAPKSFNGNWAQSGNQRWSNQAWSGNWRDHDRFRHHRGFGGFGLFAYGPGFYDYDYGGYQRRLVPTPFGWRWRTVWVCGPYSYY